MFSLRPTRLLAIAGLTLVAFLYWKPAHTYMHARRELRARNAQVSLLRAENVHLQRSLAQSATSNQLVREARRLGLVKPGERLFIVKGIPGWRRTH